MRLFGLGSNLDVVREETRRNQRDAANPVVSAWVTANAGTGKTHVLTMRLLRLLLAGTPPERILALTYTKAAAAEMSKRVFAKLSKWATATEADLVRELSDVLGRQPEKEEKRRARQLFAYAIETPGGFKVQTIHAFCERLLQRFPLEAAVPPQFQVLDEQSQRRALRQAIDETLAEATSEQDGLLSSALKTAVAFAAEDGFDAILDEVLRKRALVLGAAHETLASAEAERIYAGGQRLDRTPNAAELEEKLVDVLSDTQLRHLHSVLLSGSDADIEAAKHVADALRASHKAARIEALARLFRTTEGKKRKWPVTKRLAAEHPDLNALLISAQERFLSLYDECCRLKLRVSALALLRLADAVMQRYGAVKARRAALDFDDLTAKAAAVLAGSGAAQWVLYKLDGGIDHILVDEAQDTSPLQWRIVCALADEFFAGRGARDVVRTLFAVGDEKQSIYGFQGAAPHMFADVGERLEDRARQARCDWRRVPLTLSFRAVDPLLTAIDRIFQDGTRTPGVTGTSPLRHISNRAGQAGFIEIWHTETHQNGERADIWTPLEEPRATSPVTRLAERIVATIERWLQSGEVLKSENRPIRPGDILILVRKREPFAPAMVAALKARGIRVAGADRMVLSEHIAVQDLMAAGDFVLLPEDDLTLAALLKSPLFNFDDDDLLQIAHGRKGSLWTALAFGAQKDARFAAAVETLKRWRERADFAPPFEFYAALLDQDEGRSKMLARLGAEAADPIDEFLNLALAYDRTSHPSLQGFLAWVRSGRHEIKRDMEQGRDEVRVMTVHGAKGLEAPIVFLPDTCSAPSVRRSSALLDAPRTAACSLGVPFLWPVKGTSHLEVVRLAKAAREQAEFEEHNRLLYVAVTRARDRLYVAGFEGKSGRPGRCWYNLIKEALEGKVEKIVEPDGREVFRHGSEQTKPHERPKTSAASSLSGIELPGWAKRKAPPEPQIAVPIAPSRLAPFDMDDAGEPVERRPGALEEPAILPPRALADQRRFLRGNLTHALLQHLPSLPSETWESSAHRFLARYAAELSEEARRSIAEETLSILRDPTCAPLFGPQSRAEVSIVAEIPRRDGRGPPLRLIGQIDRLSIAEDAIWIVDYKTNRPPPSTHAQVAKSYLLQLAAYRLGVSQIYPDRPVKAALLWTDGPRLMDIPDTLLEAYQSRLWQLDPANLDA
jgi:ATP-dependent helicase/nuclease subunit A